MSFLAYKQARQTSFDIPEDAGIICDKVTVFRDTTKGTVVAKIFRNGLYVFQISVFNLLKPGGYLFNLLKPGGYFICHQV